jgi:hypothetical protein
LRRFVLDLRGLSRPTLAALLILLVGCGVVAAKGGLDKVDEIMNRDSTAKLLPSASCLPKCSADFNNYVENAKRRIDPRTVQFCTIFPDTPGVKPFTIPIVGDMTSSSVSFYPTSRAVNGDNNSNKYEYTPDRRSYDGMYHGSPPPYRYGFDAISNAEHKIGGNLGWWCTDTPQPSQIQDTTLNVTLVANAKQLTSEINNSLSHGDRSGATAAVARIKDLKTP